MTTLEQHIAALASELKMDAPLKADAPGTYTLLIDVDLSMTISSWESGVMFQCAVGICPQSNEETFFTQAMLANLFGQGTEGAILGLDETGRVLTLSLEVAEVASFQIFKEKLEDFLNAVDYWRTEISTGTKGT